MKKVSVTASIKKAVVKVVANAKPSVAEVVKNAVLTATAKK